MKHFTRILFITVLLFPGCSQRKSELSIVFEKIDNLYKGSEVKLKGYSIGAVTDIKLLKDFRVLVTIAYPKETKIHTDAKFELNSPLIGASFISIESGKSNVFLQTKDTVMGYVHASTFSDSIDSTEYKRRKEALKKIAEGFNELLAPRKDSSN